MKRIFSSSQIAGMFTQDDQDFELCATAEADFDENRSQLLLELDGFTRRLDLRSKEVHLQPAWLPRKQNLREQVAPEEALELARDIFHRWVRTLQQSMPAPVQN